MAERELVLSNGDTVVLDDNRRSLQFNIDDLYKYRLVDDGSEIVRGNGKYVPNEDDMVYAFAIGWFRVGRTDLTDYHVDLHFWEAPKSSSDVGIEDKLLGVGPGYTSESYRLYIDTRVFPYRLDVNSRLHSYGSEGKEIRIFKGVNTSATGEIISAYYTQSGDYVGDAIPLEVVATEQFNNRAVKAPVMGYTSKKMPDGELVTCVVYNTLGNVTDQFKMLVQNTNVIRHPEDTMKRVKSIELISPYLMASEPGVLLVPINVTVATLALRAKVTYIDGDTSVQDVVDEEGNGKFRLLGLKYWSPTISGDDQELTLTYELSQGEEYSYLQGETANGRVTQTYKIRAKEVDAAYSLKLYAYPTWVDNMVGYSLEYWLCDLSRQITRQVPKGAVTMSADSGPFDGLEYVSAQHLKFSVDLSVVDVGYGDHVHVQSSQIALMRDGGAQEGYWKVKFAGNQPNWFGGDLQAKVHATSGGLSTVNVGNGFADRAKWLDAVFYGTSPLYDPQTEVKAPAPTHFIIVTKQRTIEVPIAQWNNDITFINDLGQGKTIYLKWERRTGAAVLALGVTGLTVHEV